MHGSDNWMKVIRDSDLAVSWAQFEFNYSGPFVNGSEPTLVSIPLYVTRADGADFNLSKAVAAASGGPLNTPPTTNAGPDQSLRAGGTVTLAGSASFDDNTAPESLGYSWTFTSKPEGSTATVTDANTPTASFVADVAGSYVLTLVVSDEQGAVSAPDSVIISSANQAPTAFATVDFGIAIVGTTSAFDGSGSSDPEGNALTYAWVITTAPAGSMAALVGPIRRVRL